MPSGFQEFEAVRFQDNRHMKVVRLSDIRTGRLNPQELFLVLISVRGLVEPRAIMRLEVSNDTIGDQAGDFRALAQCLNQPHHGARVP